jgi:peptide/nickel transport system ATP-binding protein
MHSEVILEGKGITKHFDAKVGLFKRTKIRAVDSVDVQLFKGEILALVGESGSGKTTLGRVLAGVYQLDAGEIHFAETSVTKTPRGRRRREIAKKIQYVFQDPFSSLPPNKKIRTLIQEVLRLYRPSNSELEETTQIKSVLELVGLTPAQQIMDKYPHELSGGQRQRVSFARALAVEPKVMIADEPVSMLDVSIRAGILELMKKLRDEHGLSIIYITHDITTARVISDTIYVMYRGKVVERGPIDAVVGRPLHPYTATLISSLPSLTLGDSGFGSPIFQRTVENRSEPAGFDHCVFYSRCPMAVEICSQKEPALKEFPDNHYVACFLADKALKGHAELYQNTS